MQQLFDKIGQKLYTNNNHHGYLINYNLISALCKTWSRNREPDQTRIDEIYFYYIKGGYIPKIIHLAEIISEGLVCYDGNHRREVFNKCINSEENIEIICDIMFNVSQSDVYKSFNNINKSVQLPAIYLDEDPNINFRIKDDIIKLVKKYEIQYKSFVSASARPHSPNFNRDCFVENIFDLYQKFKLITIDEIETLLIQLNNEYSNDNMCRPHSFYKSSIIEKCRKNNFWLFLEKTIPYEHLEKLNNK